MQVSGFIPTLVISTAQRVRGKEVRAVRHERVSLRVCRRNYTSNILLEVTDSHKVYVEKQISRPILISRSLYSVCVKEKNLISWVQS